MGDGDESEMYSAAPARGYYVCDQCIDDDTIRAFIRSHREQTLCDFCERESQSAEIAAPLDEVVDFMYQSITREYERAVEILSYESAEGGYQGIYWDSQELLTGVIGLSLPNDVGNRLLEIIVDCLGDEPWCERNPYSLSEDEKLVYSWEHFCKLIKHERRYFFLQQNEQEKLGYTEHLAPAELLQLIGDTVAEHGLINTLRRDAIIYRARQQKSGEALRSAYDLGPPPVESATRSNRMSPAGIVMFYGSSEADTAIAEIDDDPMLGIVVGAFRVAKDVQVLDLTKLPARVPFFQPDCSYDRYALNFLHEFVQSLAAKVEPGDREHIEYVPTQVVTEWFRSVFQQGDSRISGIYYPSAQREGGKSLVLFADRDDLRLTAQEIEALGSAGWAENWELRERHKRAWLQLVSVKLHRPPIGP